MLNQRGREKEKEVEMEEKEEENKKKKERKEGRGGGERKNSFIPKAVIYIFSTYADVSCIM